MNWIQCFTVSYLAVVLPCVAVAYRFTDASTLNKRNTSRKDNNTWNKLELLQALIHRLRQKKPGSSQTQYRYRRSRPMYYGWVAEKENDADIPRIECPRKAGGEKLFACPSPISGTNRYVCIDDHALCDRRYDCPGKEDEDPTVCMFHKMTLNFFKAIVSAVFDLSRSIL
ncbi:uncharacterized protein LOC135488297 [Lineus longissimus]|uniref:uncharacterized protein LOC135488297 n=1 Tax=Lineus longissimus TaxID=88925 RepID=UPI002B4D47D6